MHGPRLEHLGEVLPSPWVAGGWSNTAEVLRIPQDDHNGDDYSRAQWTLIECPMSQEFKYTRLVTIGGRILAISK